MKNNCDVCDVSVDRYTSIIVPDRMDDSPSTTMCFDCADAMTFAFAKNILLVVLRRERQGRYHVEM